MIELFALILSLVLNVFQTGLSTPSRPLLRGQLCFALLVHLLSGSQDPVDLDTEVGSTLASFLASLTHSSIIKTSWIAYT